jgi:hypothetical protein
LAGIVRVSLWQIIQTWREKNESLSNISDLNLSGMAALRLDKNYKRWSRKLLDQRNFPMHHGLSFGRASTTSD